MYRSVTVRGHKFIRSAKSGKLRLPGSLLLPGQICIYLILLDCLTVIIRTLWPAKRNGHGIKSKLTKLYYNFCSLHAEHHTTQYLERVFRAYNELINSWELYRILNSSYIVQESITRKLKLVHFTWSIPSINQNAKYMYRYISII